MVRARIVATALLGLTLYAPLLAQNTQPELKLGDVTVRLGMAKAEVVSKFSEAKYLDTGTTGIYYDPGRRIVYTVKFRNNRLSFAERSWEKDDDLKESAYDAFIGVLKKTTEEGSHSCSIHYSSMADPDISADRVFITCDRDKHEVLIVKGHFLSSANGMTPGKLWYDVSERIGVSQQDRKP